MVYLHSLNEITVYTDGASSGNPGPAGWATIFPDCEYSGAFVGTNNIAELEAIVAAIEYCPPNTYLTVMTDSRCCINWITGKWKPKKENARRRVEHLRWLGKLKNIRPIFVHVKGHSGVPGNERADRLAVHERKLMARAQLPAIIAAQRRAILQCQR